MNIKKTLVCICLLGFLSLWPVATIRASYKARPWAINARETYPANLTSEGVTIAVQALFNDTLAARVFDKSDMISRGIMPLAVVIFNDNDFPVEVDGLSIELTHGDDHIRSLSPNEVVARLFRKDSTWLPRISRTPRSELNTAALDDFDSKFLMDKVVAPHDKGGGFLYLHIPESKDLLSYLSNCVVYIPNVYRRDKDTRMIFFEIGLGPAVPAPARD
jgi:hypothetical protein